MADHQNIQLLFDAIVPRQIDIYLTSRNWVGIESDDADLQTFEATHAGDLQRVSFLKSRSISGFRSRLQNLIFTLAVLYEEEPIDIANSMYKLKPEISTESSTNSTDHVDSPVSRFTIGNRFEETLDFCCNLWSSPLQIGKNETLEIVFSPCRLAQPEVIFHPKQIRLNVSESNQVRIFQGQAAETVPDKIRDQVETIVGRVAGSETVEEIAAQLEPAISRAEFELQDIEVTNDNPGAMMKPVAMLLASLAQRLPSEGTPATSLWSLCCSVLAGHETLVEISPAAKEELFTRAKQDDENAPRATLDWLKAHTWNCSLDS